MLPGRAICDGLIPFPEESHWVGVFLSVIRWNNNAVQCRFYIECPGNAPKMSKLKWTE
jgi:hypothetical protein